MKGRAKVFWGVDDRTECIILPVHTIQPRLRKRERRPTTTHGILGNMEIIREDHGGFRQGYGRYVLDVVLSEGQNRIFWDDGMGFVVCACDDDGGVFFQGRSLLLSLNYAKESEDHNEPMGYWEPQK